MNSAYRLSILAAAAISMGAGFLAVSGAQTPDERLYRPPEATLYRDAAYRVPACTGGSATASCAARTADNWCRTIGWNGSAREHVETIGGREYLADVLCVRSGY